MGGQAFASGGVLIDTTGLDRVLALDPVRGTVRAQAGIQWPALVQWLVAAQGARAGTWGIRQKQTGADRLSLGGALAANIHGRGLCSRPLVEDLESLLLVDPRGRLRTCDRGREPWLFRRVVGGYGLFGAVAEVTLRLARRRKLVRLVRMLDGGDPVRALEAAAEDGAPFGDCQLAIDHRSPDFLRQGVVSSYHPVADELPVPAGQRALSEAAWRRLIRRAHTHKTPAFEEYAAHYRATSGQVYWSDLHQLGTYVDGYHDEVDRALGCALGSGGSEMITELYVPRARLPHFLEALRSELRARSADVIYATVRLIEAERETALPWARQPWACLVLNLHTAHEPRALRRTADTFRALIDRALDQGGTYYLTYHRWARRDQLERGHPALADLLRDKRAFDPDERFTSDWYRHHRALLAASPRGRTPAPAGIMPPRRPPRFQPRGLP
jgi:FAD/FMN-containing dehydrogenase